MPCTRPSTGESMPRKTQTPVQGFILASRPVGVSNSATPTADLRHHAAWQSGRMRCRRSGAGRRSANNAGQAVESMKRTLRRGRSPLPEGGEKGFGLVLETMVRARAARS
jgi:hypothetical protein